MPANRRVPRVVGCDGFNSAQLSRQTTDLRKIAAFYEAVAVLDRHDPLSPGEALHPLVTVQDHLRTKRWIAAHPDRYMTPLLIYQMKVEMPDIRPAFSMPYLGDPTVSIALDFPYRSRSVAFDHEKQAAKFRLVGLVRLRQFVLAVACLRLDDGNTLLGAERMEAARKGPRHFAQMFIVEIRIVAIQTSPPRAHAASRLSQWIESVQHNTVHAVVGPLQQLGVVLRKLIGRDHTKAPHSSSSVSGYERK